MLVDSYGVNSYMEVNPAVYTIATFPFLFAVMFGDFGHGIILFLFGLFMVLREKSLEKQVENNEIGTIFFGGRYIITMMGAFSIYTGLIYNDVFSKSVSIFPSAWYYRDNFTFPLQMEDPFMLDPGNITQYRNDPYYLGMDPAWLFATNKITFLNTFKMKFAIIVAISHMFFGLCLSMWNKILKRTFSDIILEVIPQMVFLISLFGYLVFMIFFKWVAYYADTPNKDHNTHSEHCAPNLLITFINMMLFKNEPSDPALEQICKGYEKFMYGGQYGIQMFLVVIGVLMVPIMLFGKPVYARYSECLNCRVYFICLGLSQIYCIFIQPVYGTLTRTVNKSKS